MEYIVHFHNECKNNILNSWLFQGAFPVFKPKDLLRTLSQTGKYVVSAKVHSMH